MVKDSSTTSRPPHQGSLAKKAAALARAVEHQRLSSGVKKLPLASRLPWEVVIGLARETWDMDLERPYLDYVRHHAYLDAADAIARRLLGEA